MALNINSDTHLPGGQKKKANVFLDIVMKLSLLIAEIGSHLGLYAASLQFTLTNKDASGSIRQPTYNINKWVT